MEYFKEKSHLKTACLEFSDESEHSVQLWVCPQSLAVQSPVFERMLFGDFKEKHEQVVDLHNEKLEEFLIFLQWMHPTPNFQPYPNHIHQLNEHAFPLLKLADRYQVDWLKQQCGMFLEKKLKNLDIKTDSYTENGEVKSLILEILSAALSFKMESLAKVAIGKAIYLKTETMRSYAEKIDSKIFLMITEMKSDKHASDSFAYGYFNFHSIVKIYPSGPPSCQCKGLVKLHDEEVHSSPQLENYKLPCCESVGFCCQCCGVYWCLNCIKRECINPSTFGQPLCVKCKKGLFDKSYISGCKCLVGSNLQNMWKNLHNLEKLTQPSGRCTAYTVPIASDDKKKWYSQCQNIETVVKCLICEKKWCHNCLKKECTRAIDYVYCSQCNKGLDGNISTDGCSCIDEEKLSAKLANIQLF